MDQDRILSLICALPALVAGLTLHEFAHAWTADKLGDPTPRREGRLTLDPMVHIDPIGAIFFIVSSLIGFGLGWAKPVMTNPRNLQHPRRDSLLIAIAGPVSNVLQTPFWLFAMFVYGFVAQKFNWPIEQTRSIASIMLLVLIAGVTTNLGLAAFNMVPIPPLDGHWILQSLVGRPLEILFDQIRPFGFIILLFVMRTPLFDYVLGPIHDLALTTAIHALTAGMKLAG